MRQLVALAAVLVAGCSRTPEKESQVQVAPPLQQVSDPSKDTLLITANRLGRVPSCATLASIKQSYPGSRDTLTPTEDPETHQAGVVVDLGSGERTLYVASWTDSSHAWTLGTNSPRFHTRRGLHVGSTYSDVLRTGDSLEFSLPEGFVVATIVPEGISFMVDDRSATRFYNRFSEANLTGGRELMDSGARIVEFITGHSCRK